MTPKTPRWALGPHDAATEWWLIDADGELIEVFWEV